MDGQRKLFPPSMVRQPRIQFELLFAMIELLILSSPCVTTPRLLFAMAEQKQLPRMFGAVHESFRTPVAAIVFTAAVSIALGIFSSFVSALTVSAVVRLAAYAMTCAALPLMRRDPSAPPAAFSAPAGTAVSIAAVVLSLWLLSNSPSNEMKISLVALAVGFVAYAIWRRK